MPRFIAGPPVPNGPRGPQSRACRKRLEGLFWNPHQCGGARLDLPSPHPPGPGPAAIATSLEIVLPRSVRQAEPAWASIFHALVASPEFRYVN